MLPRLLLLGTLTFHFAGCAPSGRSLTAEERQLSELMTAYYADLETFWGEADRFTSRDEYDEAIASGQLIDPGLEYVERLLDFEEEHRGSEVGLLALWHVFREAARGGDADDPAPQGRLIAVDHLHEYGRHGLFARVAPTSLDGNYSEPVRQALVEVSRSAGLNENNRAALQYALAKQAFGVRDTTQKTIDDLARLRDGTLKGARGTIPRVVAWLEENPTLNEWEGRCRMAVETLEQLAEDAGRLRIPELEQVAGDRYVFEAVNDRVRPTIAELAEAALFKERHLLVGQQAPNLEVELLDGTQWELSAQRGSVTIIQFSFTGCGPCERMYPTLAELTAKHGDKVAIVTLMRDEPKDWAHQAVADGKITWDVAHDGNPGRVATRWSVEGFPTTYVIDTKGQIAAIDLRGQQLQAEVADLVAKRDS